MKRKAPRHAIELRRWPFPFHKYSFSCAFLLSLSGSLRLEVSLADMDTRPITYKAPLVSDPSQVRQTLTVDR